MLCSCVERNLGNSIDASSAGSHDEFSSFGGVFAEVV
jgi:hypothetical protein